jgi:hypothetical protein
MTDWINVIGDLAVFFTILMYLSGWYLNDFKKFKNVPNLILINKNTSQTVIKIYTAKKTGDISCFPFLTTLLK